MSLILNKIVGKTIVITEYNIAVQLPCDGVEGKQYKVRYVHHNGYTRIQAMFADKDSFGDWLNTFNIRFERHKRVQLVPRWKRERLVTDWAFSAIEQAYATYLTEVTTTASPDPETTLEVEKNVTNGDERSSDD